MPRALSAVALMIFLRVGAASSQRLEQPPDTPVGHVLTAWLAAFNSGDAKLLTDYVKLHDSSQTVDGMRSFRTQTGGFERRSIEASGPYVVAFQVKEKAGTTTAFGEMQVGKDAPEKVVFFSLLAAPPGAKYEGSVAIREAVRRKADVVRLGYAARE